MICSDLQVKNYIVDFQISCSHLQFQKMTLKLKNVINCLKNRATEDELLSVKLMKGLYLYLINSSLDPIIKPRLG